METNLNAVQDEKLRVEEKFAYVKINQVTNHFAKIMRLHFDEVTIEVFNIEPKKNEFRLKFFETLANFNTESVKFNKDSCWIQDPTFQAGLWSPFVQIPPQSEQKGSLQTIQASDEQAFDALISQLSQISKLGAQLNGLKVSVEKAPKNQHYDQKILSKEHLDSGLKTAMETSKILKKMKAEVDELKKEFKILTESLSLE